MKLFKYYHFSTSIFFAVILQASDNHFQPINLSDQETDSLIAVACNRFDMNEESVINGYAYTISPLSDQILVIYNHWDRRGVVVLFEKRGDEYIIRDRAISWLEDIVDIRIIIHNLCKFILLSHEKTRALGSCVKSEEWVLFKITDEMKLKSLIEMEKEKECRWGWMTKYYQHSKNSLYSANDSLLIFIFRASYSIVNKDDKRDTLFHRIDRLKLQYYPQIDNIAEYLVVANTSTDRYKEGYSVSEGDTLGVMVQRGIMEPSIVRLVRKTGEIDLEFKTFVDDVFGVNKKFTVLEAGYER